MMRAEKIRLATEVGQRLRAKRTAAGLTKATFAAQLGIGASTLAKIEEGVQSATIFQLYRAAMVFDCSLDDLVPVLVEGEAKAS